VKAVPNLNEWLVLFDPPLNEHAKLKSVAVARSCDHQLQCWLPEPQSKNLLRDCEQEFLSLILFGNLFHFVGSRSADFEDDETSLFLSGLLKDNLDQEDISRSASTLPCVVSSRIRLRQSVSGARTGRL
jgi:hypothetical protein